MVLPLLAPWSTALALALPAFQQPPPTPPAAAPAPAAAAATKYEFPTQLAPGESRLLEIRTATNSTIHLDVAGKAVDNKERGDSTTWIVDTLLDPASQPKDHVWSGKRRIVKAQATKDGAVDDPESNGFEANVWVDNTSHIHFESTNERLLTKSKLDELVQAAEAFGLGVGVQLPASGAVGDEFEMPFATLSPWCLTTDGKTPKASAKLRFESVDAKKNLAHWKGPLHVEESVDKSAEELDAPFGVKGTGTYEGVVSIDYDVAAHVIARIVCRAKGDLVGETVGAVKAKVSGTSVIETTITCSTGAAAAAALKEKTQFRDVPHDCPDARVSIALPSHFTKLTVQQPGCAAHRSLLRGKDALATVALVPLVLQAKTVKEAGEESRKELEAGGYKVKDATVSGGLGAASACEYTNADVHGLNAVFMLDPGRFVIVQCSCPESAWATWSKEWPKYLQSLKKMSATK